MAIRINYQILFLVLAILFVISGIIGLIDRGNAPYGGYLTEGNNTIIRIDAESPAARAGLKVGDYIRSVGGIPVENSRALAERVRPLIGQMDTLVVERRSATAPGAAPAILDVHLTYAASPTKNAALGFAGFIIGLCFVVCGLTAYARVPGRSAALLALTGLCLGVSFLGTPYFSSPSVRALVQSFLSIVVVLGFASLLHFVLESPKRKALLRQRHAMMLLYGPALMVALYLLFLIVVRPPATSGLNQLSNLLIGLFVVTYFGGAAIAMTHSYVTATPQERSGYGLNIELVGILIGILPVTIGLLLRVLAPSLALPGVEFYFLSVIFIPIVLVVAVLRQAPAAGR